MRIAYADPPYPGQSKKHYGQHADYAGEVDHAALLEQLAGYDGWVLHTSSRALRDVLPLCPSSVRVGAWVKPFAAVKPGVVLTYAWEPVIFEVAREQVRGDGYTMFRDWLSEPIAMRRGLAGAKPDAVVVWALRCCGAERGDVVDDLFPGSGAVARAVAAWQAAAPLWPDAPLTDEQALALDGLELGT